MGWVWDYLPLSRKTDGRSILIVEDKDARYAQVLAYEGGSVYAETVSNQYLRGEQRWSEHDEAKLKALGWRAPGRKKVNRHATFQLCSRGEPENALRPRPVPHGVHDRRPVAGTGGQGHGSVRPLLPR